MHSAGRPVHLAGLGPAFGPGSHERWPIFVSETRRNGWFRVSRQSLSGSSR